MKTNEQLSTREREIRGTKALQLMSEYGFSSWERAPDAALEEFSDFLSCRVLRSE